MIIVDNELVIFVDVDDTLITWQDKTNKSINISSPYDGSDNWVTPHKGHIKILKDRKARGSRIFVWSQGGWAWAEAVVKALDLTKYVDFVMSKPYAYIDDLTANEILGERIYLGRDSKYGETNE